MANGDDLSILGALPMALDDEDGVVFGESWVDVTFNINREGVRDYQLRAWWDTNENGRFDHPGNLAATVTRPELYINDILSLGPGSITVRYDLAFDPRDYYGRFRLTCDPLGAVTPSGEVFSNIACDVDPGFGPKLSHGEVEDYSPLRVPGPLPLLGVCTAFGYSRKLRKRIKGTIPVASAIV